MGIFLDFSHFTFWKILNAKLGKAFQLIVSLPVPYTNIPLYQELRSFICCYGEIFCSDLPSGIWSYVMYELVLSLFRYIKVCILK